MTARAVPVPDPIAAGKILAELQGFQAIYFTLIFVIVLFALVIVYLVMTRNSSEKAGREMAQKFADAADKVAEATKDSDTQIAVQLALIQQKQQDSAGKLDELLRREGR